VSDAQRLADIVASLGLLAPRPLFAFQGTGPTTRPVLRRSLMASPPPDPYEYADLDVLAPFVAHLPPSSQVALRQRSAACLEGVCRFSPGDRLFDRTVDEATWQRPPPPWLGLELSEPLVAPSGEVLLFWLYRHVQAVPPLVETRFFAWVEHDGASWSVCTPSSLGTVEAWQAWPG